MCGCVCGCVLVLKKIQKRMDKKGYKGKKWGRWVLISVLLFLVNKEKNINFKIVDLGLVAFSCSFMAGHASLLSI